jgi:hypothetical protein
VTEEVPRILRNLQTIRLGGLRLGPNAVHPLKTEIPPNFECATAKIKPDGALCRPAQKPRRVARQNREYPGIIRFFIKFL